ncbi:MAG TPA: TerB family tellurite resistance protein [Xanthobacteraceae bacterium]|nr:TerB family tellurite resistance protein [Xanthobacteraceae bacterium]
MLKEIKDFFADLGGSEQPVNFSDGDYRVAAAALMVHLATLDHDLSAPDRETLHALLKSRFDLTDELTAELIDAAVAADHEAVDFYHFTHTLMRVLDEPGRRRIVEMMWQLIYADHKVSEFEDNMMWRVADLLGVSAQERLELKRRAAEVAQNREN